MGKYFQYVELNTFKRKSIWISAAVYWLYIGVIVLLIPAALHVPPAILWNNAVFELQGFCLMILAIVCSIMAVVIFRESRDDGTELIIMSKPINRWKIVIVKFICFLITSTLVILGGALLLVCTLFFGEYSPSNLNGMDYTLLPSMIGGLMLGGMVTILLFGAISILISAFAGKVAIMITTIGLAIIINVLQQVLPYASTTATSYVKNEYSMDLLSHRYVGTDGALHDTFHAKNVTDEYTSLYFAKEGLEHETGAIACYANIGQQLTSLYHAFGTQEVTMEAHSNFGSKYDKKYTITNNEKSIYLNSDGSDTKNYGDSDVPWTQFGRSENQGAEFMQYRTYGLIGSDEDASTFGSIVGASASSLYYIVTSQPKSILDLVDTEFINMNEITNLRNEANTKAYVNWLMSKTTNSVGPNFTPVPSAAGGGYTIQWFAEHRNESNDVMPRLRLQIAGDLLGDNEAVCPEEAYIKNGASLGYDVYKGEEYNQSMDMDFLQVIYQIQLSMEKQLWAGGTWAETAAQWTGIQGEIADHKLKPVNKWDDYDKTPDAFGAMNMLQWYKAGSPSSTNKWYVLRTNDAISNLRFNTPFSGYSTPPFPPFSTDRDSKSSGNGWWSYVDKSRETKRINVWYGWTKWSQVFASMYGYSQTELIQKNSTVAFWVSISFLFFALTAIVYARTDIK